MSGPSPLTILLALLAAACATRTEAAPPAVSGMRALENAWLPHLIQASPRVFSGAAPAGPDAFAELARLGVRTVVSVDGAAPDVEEARRHGLRTVHVPFGYDGVPADAALQIARVMEETEGAVYFHCHHGQHRGPAAAAIGLRLDLRCSGPEAVELMRLAETDPKYAGLWRDVAAFEPPPPGAALPELHAIAPVGDFTAGMARLDRDWDRVRAVRAASWSVPPAHPDLVPAREARILSETLAALGARLAPEHAADEVFLRQLRTAQQGARDLRAALEAGDPEAAEQRFAALKRGCTACHDDYRN
jgi:hypothetical protein